MKLVFTSNATPWPESIDCRSGLHQESRKRLWLTRERKVSFCHPRKEWFKISLAEQWHPPRKSIHHRQRHSPTYPEVGGIVEVRIGMCPWDENIELKWKLNSKSRWWGQAAGVNYVASSWRGWSRIFFSFFFLRMILVSQWLVGSLCTVHSAFSGSEWFALFTFVWWI